MGNEKVITLYSSRSQHGLYLIMSALFVTGGIWVVSSNPSEGTFTMWTVIIFFGLCGVVFVYQLIHPSSLTLDQKGFTMRGMSRKNFIAWDQVKEFVVYYNPPYGVPKMVGMFFKPHVEKAAFGRALTKNLTGVEGAIPDAYGIKPEVLCTLCNEWRERNYISIEEARRIAKNLSS